MRRILCLRFPAWPLQRLVASKRSWNSPATMPAIVIYYRDARRGDIVHHCSAAAWQQGVRPGIPVAEAAALFADPQQFHLAAHDAAADHQWLARIATWCERYSPQVGWNTVAAGKKEVLRLLPTSAEPDSLFLEITGIGALFQGEELLAESLSGDLAKRRLRARIGIADTLGAAWALAMARGHHTISIAAPGDLQTLRALPVECLRLLEDTVDTLHRLGIDSIDQLLQLPRNELRSRFGDGLLLRIDQACGQAVELIEPHRAEAAFQAEWLLEHATTNRDTIEHIVSELIARLVLQLSQRRHGVAQLTCRLDVEGSPPLCFTLGLYKPTASLKHLQELVQMQLERAKLRAAVGRIRISATQTTLLEMHQTQLFEGDQIHCQRAATDLLNRLSARLGQEAVLQPNLQADALPERAVELTAAVLRATKKTSSRFRGSIAYRPLLLFSPPVKLDTVALAPDGPPIRFHYQHRLHDVAHYWGPERIETAWWRGRSVRRDYFRVETAEGTRFWLFRCLHNAEWFLHGLFE